MDVLIEIEYFYSVLEVNETFLPTFTILKFKCGSSEFCNEETTRNHKFKLRVSMRLW